MNCFEKAVTKYGAPDSVYFDNGSPYKNKHLLRCCGLLGIRKLHTRPYSPQSKGKVEKYHQVVDSFISEVEINPVSTFEELNYRWNSYFEVFYNTIPHSGLESKNTPYVEYISDKKPIRLISQEKIHEAFLCVEHGRKVDKSGCVNFRGIQYEAEGLMAFAGSKVSIVWEPSDNSKVWIEISGLPLLAAKPLVIKEFVNKKRLQFSNNNIIIKADKSRVSDAANLEYEKREKKRIELSTSQSISNLLVAGVVIEQNQIVDNSKTTQELKSVNQLSEKDNSGNDSKSDIPTKKKTLRFRVLDQNDK
jgi:hypothetical protein